MAEEEAELLLAQANDVIEAVGRAEDELQAAHKRKRQQHAQQKQRADAEAKEAAAKVLHCNNILSL